MILDWLGDIGGGRVLDVGCGKGRFARLVKERHPAATVVAMDLAVSMLGYADANLARTAGSMLDLPFAAGSFDGAYATESLEHAVDIERAVGEICRVVKAGGRIVVIDKNAAHWGKLKTPQWEKWFHDEELEEVTSPPLLPCGVEANQLLGRCRAGRPVSGLARRALDQ